MFLIRWGFCFWWTKDIDVVMCRLTVLFPKFFKSSHAAISALSQGTCIGNFLFLFLFFLAEEQQKSEGGQETQNLIPNQSFDKSQLNDCPRDSGCYISSENSDNGKEEADSEALSDMVQSITISESNWFGPAAFLQIFRKDNHICQYDGTEAEHKVFSTLKSYFFMIHDALNCFICVHLIAKC